MSFVVAIDGPAAAGKGTIAKAIAAQFGFHHLDTGLLYRAVAGKLIASGQSPNDLQPAVQVARSLMAQDIEAQNLRTAKVAQAASLVAAMPEVREALTSFQHRFAALAPGAVLDGRDIGTVICPDADVKLYITASAEVRAQRRFEELLGRGAQTTLARCLTMCAPATPVTPTAQPPPWRWPKMRW